MPEPTTSAASTVLLDSLPDPFPCIPQDKVHLIAHIAHPRTYSSNEIILAQGTRVSGLYIIWSGRVEEIKEINDNVDGEGKLPTRYTTIEPMLVNGDLIGVPALFLPDQLTSPSTFKCVSGPIPPNGEDCNCAEVFFIDGKDFLKLMESEPTIAVSLVTSFARRLHEGGKLLEFVARAFVKSEGVPA